MQKKSEVHKPTHEKTVEKKGNESWESAIINALRAAINLTTVQAGHSSTPTHH